MCGLPRTIAMLILDFMKIELSEKDFPDFLAMLPARFCSTFKTTFLVPSVACPAVANLGSWNIAPVTTARASLASA